MATPPTTRPNTTLVRPSGCSSGPAPAPATAIGQQAFFFVDGRYIGTDAKEPSASVKVVSQSDTEVTLAYPLYRHSDPLCCPGGGQATVHFVLDNGRLQALDPIPPASSTHGPEQVLDGALPARPAEASSEVLMWTHTRTHPHRKGLR